LLHGMQLRRTADELLEIIAEREQKEEWLKASTNLDRYLHLRPGDAEARGRLALDFARSCDDPSMGMQKRQAIDLHYRALAVAKAENAPKLRASLMQLLLDQARFSEAETEAKRILDHDPDNPQAAKAYAIALASQLADGSLANANTKQMRLVKSLEKAHKLN